MRARSFWCAVLVVGLALTAQLAFADVIIWAEEDTFTSQKSGETATNFNGQGLLVKSQVGSRRSSWVECVLGTVQAQSASLCLYLSSIPSGWGTSHTVIVVANQYNMNEATLTYNTAPSTTTWTTMTGWTASAIGQYYSADVTSFYNANLGKRCTFKITQSDSNSVGGAYEDTESKYGTTNYPYLNVAPIPEPGGLLALGSAMIGLAGIVTRRRR